MDGDENGKSRLDRIEELLERHSQMFIEHGGMLVGHDEAIAEHRESIARIDEMIERQVLATEEAHQRFREEDKWLLRAQVVMHDSMQRLETKMEETTDKLNALITTVDGLIGKRPETGEKQ